LDWLNGPRRYKLNDPKVLTNSMSRDVLDDELENAKHDMVFCFAQIKDLEPWAQQISEGGSLDKTFINKLLNNKEIDLWDSQFRGLLLKTIHAQAKYIRLLERRIGK
jgi:hypothetical protein